MSVTTSFAEINKYFYSHCTDEDKKVVTSDKCKEYLRAVFSDYIIYVESTANINYTTELITTDETMSEIEKNLLGLMMYKKHLEIQNMKYGKLANLTSDSHKITGLGDVKKALKDILDDTEKKINDFLATLL